MTNWLRVTRAHRCAICRHDHYCLVARDGSAYICMWTENEHPYQFSDDKIGYIHRVNGRAAPMPPPRVVQEPSINPTKIMEGFSAQTWPERTREFAASLGVSFESLCAIGCAWAVAHNAWAFPMRDSAGGMVGIRLRNERGDKWAVKGSHQGIFLPHTEPQRLAILTEGPTSCAAGLTLGYFTIGLPSAGAGLSLVKDALTRLRIRQVVVCADNKQYDDGREDRGLRSATFCSERLNVSSAVLVLPAAKDLRQFIELGGTRRLLDSYIEQLVWRQA